MNGYIPTPDYYRDFISHDACFVDEDELYHYGVKGMKWGIRKAIQRSANRNAQRMAARMRVKQEKRLAKGKAPKTLKTRSYDKMIVDKSDSAVTKRVKNDFNSLNDQEFMNKYKVKKKRYEKRVKKYGDPYKHRVNSKSYQMLKKLNS